MQVSATQTKLNSLIAGIRGGALPTNNDPEQIHRISLQRLQELGMSPITLAKTKFDISDECTDRIICELRNMLHSTHDESSKIILIDELKKYRNGLETIGNPSNYPNSIDIKSELDFIIEK